MKYKSIFVSAGLIVGTMAIVGIYFTVPHYKKVNFSKRFIENMGGEQMLKKQCVQEYVGPYKMDDGKIREHILTLGDIARISKLCDCAVKNLYNLVPNIPSLGELDVNSLPIETRQVLMHSLVVVSYGGCEAEVIELLENKYPTIDVD